jgi:hypothetical protein
MRALEICSFWSLVEHSDDEPSDIRDALLGLDRKYREAEYRRAEDPEWEMPPEQARLSEEEKRGLLFVSHFFPENPI